MQLLCRTYLAVAAQSAVAYFYSRAIMDETRQSFLVGTVYAGVGFTRPGSWRPAEAMSACALTDVEIATTGQWDAALSRCPAPMTNRV
jgi:hypothetical protein